MTPIPQRQSNWSLVCQSVNSHALSMKQSRSKIAADFIMDQAEVFCAQSPPQNPREQNQRKWQQDDLTGRFSFITYADETAKRNSENAEKIFEFVRQYLKTPLATSDRKNDVSLRRRLELTQYIAGL
jgi:hypothetical protein